MFRLLCFDIIMLLHYLLDTYMCKGYNGWDILVISREMTDCTFSIIVFSKYVFFFNFDFDWEGGWLLQPGSFPAPFIAPLTIGKKYTI
jgi:hypothetical protein